MSSEFKLKINCCEVLLDFATVSSFACGRGKNRKDDTKWAKSLVHCHSESLHSATASGDYSTS